jgi:hypothetical protein
MTIARKYISFARLQEACAAPGFGRHRAISNLRLDRGGLRSTSARMSFVRFSGSGMT